MKILLSVFVLALLTTGAVAQQGFKGGPPKQAPAPVDSAEEKRAAEKAYQKALQVIPNVTDKKADPWKGAR